MSTPTVVRREPAPAAAADAGARERDTSANRRSLVLSLVTLVLILGATVGFLRAQTLKLEPSPFSRQRVEQLFSPTSGSPSKASATLAFTVRIPVRVKAEMIDARSRPVRTLAADVRWRRGRRTLQWDGRDDRGRVVPDGSYQLRLTLLDRGRRQIVVPTPVTVDTRPPRVTVLDVAPRQLVLGGSGRPAPHPLVVRYQSSKPARAYLVVDGRMAIHRPPRPAGTGSIEWTGMQGGRAVRPGPHVLTLVLRDNAGNLGVSQQVRVLVSDPRAKRR